MINEKIGINSYTALYIKQISKGPPHSTRNFTQYSATTYTGRESKQECVCVYV